MALIFYFFLKIVDWPSLCFCLCPLRFFVLTLKEVVNHDHFVLDDL